MKPFTEPNALKRWLVAEEAGGTEAADAALREVLETLAPLTPPAGFAERVLARVQAAPATAIAGAAKAAEAARATEEGAAPASGRRRLFATRWQQAAVAACFAGAVYALLWLPAALQALPGASLLATLVARGADLLTTLDGWLVSALSLGEKLMLLGRALAEPLATAPIVALAAACLAVSALALRSLRELIRRDRRWVYADPI